MKDFPHTIPKGSEAEIFIQWKGSNICLDFHCPCQPKDAAYSSHYDGDFAYAVKCPKCGAIWQLGTQVIVKRNDTYTGVIRELSYE